MRSARKASRAQYMSRTFTGRPIAAAPAAIVPAAWSLSAVPENRTRERLSFIGGSPGFRHGRLGGGAGPRSRDRSGGPRGGWRPGRGGERLAGRELGGDPVHLARPFAEEVDDPDPVGARERAQERCLDDVDLV